jgi:hypothetical protein
MRRLVLVVLAVVALPACSSRSRPAARVYDGGDAGSDGAPLPSASSEVRTTPSPVTPPAASGSPPPSVPPEFWNMKPGENKKIWGDMKLDVEVSPMCAKTGTAMKAVVHTLKGASIGAAVRYPDNDPHGDFSWSGPEYPSEKWVWAWTIKPGIPKGTATVMVTAGKAGERGASRAVAFKIADRC